VRRPTALAAATRAAASSSSRRRARDAASSAAVASSRFSCKRGVAAQVVTHLKKTNFEKPG
jgi:hypothetical protein